MVFFLPGMSHSQSAHPPLSATPNIFLHLYLPLSRSFLVPPPECLHWEISVKVFHLFQPPLQTYFSRYLLHSVSPWIPMCTCVLEWAHMCVWSCMCSLLRVCPCKKRKCSRWPLILVAFSPLLWSKKLKVQAWAPSRQLVKDAQIYKHVGSRDTFSWRVNMLWLCLYNNCAAVRGRRCLIPGWLGIIWSCTVQAATLHHFAT